MTEKTESDYVLGTNEEEIDRLGLQHRVWRPTTLECWRRAGITIGSRVIDIGCGPGYATIDLAEIVGRSGEILAIERSPRFLKIAQDRCRPGPDQCSFSSGRFDGGLVRRNRLRRVMVPLGRLFCFRSAEINR